MNRRQLANDVAIFAAVAIFVAVALVAFGEIELAISVPGRVYVSIGIAAVALGGLVMAINSNLKRWAITFLLLSLLGVLLRVLYAVDWTPRKPFLHDLNRIQNGMSKAEVEQIMAAYIRVPDSNGLFRDTVSFRHSEDPSFNADCAMIRFRNGRVVSVDFSPD